MYIKNYIQAHSNVVRIFESDREPPNQLPTLNLGEYKLKYNVSFAST